LSYAGSTPWEVAATDNPYLKTIVPVEGVINLFSMSLARGENDWRWWAFVPAYYDLNSWTTNNAVLSGKDDAPATIGTIACPDQATGLAASIQSAFTGVPDSFGYWAARSYGDAIVQHYRGSVLLVQGLQDPNVLPSQPLPWISGLERQGVYVKELLGQWQHEYPDDPGLPRPIRRADFTNILLTWFSRWLQGDTSAALGPRVEVEDSLRQWRTESSWPPADARNTTYHLGASGSLSTRQTPGSSTVLLGSDQRSRYTDVNEGTGVELGVNDMPMPASVETTCVTCAVLQLPVQKAALRISGIPHLHLTGLQPTGPGATVGAFLYSVAHGIATRIGWGELDLRFARGNNTPQIVTPGQPVDADITFMPMDAAVPVGASLVLVVSQGEANHLHIWPTFPVKMTYGGNLATLDLPLIETTPSKYIVPAG